MPRKPLLPYVPLKFKDLLDGVLKVKPPAKKKLSVKTATKKPRRK
jgi:hypothetical protein